MLRLPIRGRSLTDPSPYKPVREAAKAGAHVATVPPKILRQLYDHPLTDKGLAAFLADWAKTGQSIL